MSAFREIIEKVRAMKPGSAIFQEDISVNPPGMQQMRAMMVHTWTPTALVQSVLGMLARSWELFLLALPSSVLQNDFAVVRSRIQFGVASKSNRHSTRRVTKGTMVPIAVRSCAYFRIPHLASQALLLT
mmetsp:Transcript_30899/g.95620  ORF Transcript_30899/g.95620 Transcript_30899/m.95620 type:complete len:129 (+) Transcript_30899:1456-1842(+)